MTNPLGLTPADAILGKSFSYTINEDLLGDNLTLYDKQTLINIVERERSQSLQHVRTISSLEAACAKERELRLQQSAVANEIDTLRAELSRTKLELEEERTRTAQLSRTVDTIQRSHQAQFRIDNTSFYTEQIAHLTHEIQDMTRQLKDERARSAQHMRTVSELEFTLNQERESNAQINDSARMEIASLTFQVDELSRELSDERDRVAQNTRAISMLENDLACERTEREANLNNATDDLTHVRMELHRTRQLLESERSRCAQHVSTIQELEDKMKKERDELSNGSGKSIKQIAELQGELQRVGLLLDQERDHTSQLTKSLATVEQELSKHRETWRSERQNFEQTIEQYKRGAADNQNAKNEFAQLKDELKEKDARIRTLEMEHSRITYELGVAHQAITDRRTKEEELARGLSDLQNKNSVLQQDFSTSERRVQDLTRRLEDVNTRYMELEQKSSKNTETHTVECRNLETKLQTSYSELSSLRAHLQQHLEKIAEQTHKINELELSLSAERSIKQTSEGRIQKEVESIERRAQESLIALSEERARVSVLERKISELEVAQIRLSAEAEEATNRLKRKTTECEEIEVRVRERDAALVGERDRVQELTRQIRSLEDAATAMRSDVERTQSELRQSREANSSVATEVTRLQSTLETERKRIVTLNTRITELESELRTESERRQLLDRSNKDVDGVRTKLENDLHDVQRALAEERRKISDLQRSNSELMSAARNHQSELDRVKDHERVRISELEHKLTLVREECTTVHRERESLRVELSNASKVVLESKGPSAKEIELNASVQLMSSELDGAKRLLEKERSRNKELASSLRDLESERHEWLMKLHRSTSVSSLNMESVQAEAEMRANLNRLEGELHDERCNVNRLTTDIISLKEEKTSFLEQIANLQLEIGNLRRVVDEERNRVREANNRVLQFQDEMDKKNKQTLVLQEQLNQQRTLVDTQCVALSDVKKMREQMRDQTLSYENELERLKETLTFERSQISGLKGRVAELETSLQFAESEYKRQSRILEQEQKQRKELNALAMQLQADKDQAENDAHLFQRQVSEFQSQLMDERTRTSQRISVYENEVATLRTTTSMANMSPARININVTEQPEVALEIEKLTHRLSQEIERSATQSKRIAELEDRLRLLGDSASMQFSPSTLGENLNPILKEKTDELRKVRRELLEERDRVLELQRQVQMQLVELHRLNSENKEFKRRLEDERRLRQSDSVVYSMPEISPRNLQRQGTSFKITTLQSPSKDKSPSVSSSHTEARSAF